MCRCWYTGSGCDGNQNLFTPFVAHAFLQYPSRSRSAAPLASAPRWEHAPAPSLCAHLCLNRIGQRVEEWQGPPVKSGSTPVSVRSAAEPDLHLGLALPAQVAIEEALHRGRCRIEADSQAAPQLHSRARREVPSHCRRSRRNHDVDMHDCGRECGAMM